MIPQNIKHFPNELTTLSERADARKRMDFATSDRIRDELAARGVIIEDGPQGARWKLASSTGAKHDECPA
jgi:cysteinyl-tRNA synthetase